MGLFHTVHFTHIYKIGKAINGISKRHVGYLPECVVVCKPWVIYLELGRCLLLLSNQFSTSNTACGFFFCSCLLMLEFFSMSAHCSGIPCKFERGNMIEISILLHTWHRFCGRKCMLQSINNNQYSAKGSTDCNRKKTSVYRTPEHTV